jgi:uncharacterized surface protein with fasciclin (FAS1) repeats
MRAALLPLLLLSLVACGEEEPLPTTTETGVVGEVNPSLIELLRSDPQFSTLLTAVVATNLEEPLSDTTTTLTLFAPTNAAFNALPEGIIDTLMTESQRETLRNILLHHLVDGTNFATDAMTAGQLTTLLGDSVPIVVADDGETITVDDATLQARDLEASNGVIHVIDRVMLPPTEEAPAEGAAAEGAAVDD